MSAPDLYRAAERLMAMDDRAWARHANPWSVWTRAATPLPLLALAIWSRVWIGSWAWAAVVLVCLWILVNPRLFPAPDRLDSWAARGVMGERVLLRHRARIAPHHLRVARLLSGVSAVGVLPYAWGLWQLDPWATITGIVLVAGSKLWFVDRMAWVWEDFTRSGGTTEDLSAPE
ncbi:DUF6653 family protein [Histidinibacterium aquaticum]|uniref:Uncharacterized protein n=1 Tax=Histidinibacterium aquaticum TaxID=2613962 RepID=A0A5J5GS62_9RHOB|nr:DUF6653 family protein [Histidinibacterium aquaticum]KAA9010394.1 hypothetical protein F3S47_03885 [Histidinibacterium aquaticum]